MCVSFLVIVGESLQNSQAMDQESRRFLFLSQPCLWTLWGPGFCSRKCPVSTTPTSFSYNYPAYSQRQKPQLLAFGTLGPSQWALDPSGSCQLVQMLDPGPSGGENSEN